MRIEPASVNQLRMAENGKMVEVDRDVGGVAADLKKIDSGLKVRFSITADEPFFAVYHEHHDGCPHNGDGNPGSTYLVTTVKAVQNLSGTWEGLDQRMVRRIMEIGHSSYDYAGELEKANRRAKTSSTAELRTKMSEMSEQAAHALRKDMGWRYRGRTFVPKDLPAA